MGIQDLFLVSLALSLDAFGVMLCITINNKINFKTHLYFFLSFSFFQFFLSFLGGYGGISFNRYVFSIPSVIGGIIIIIVGIMMILEGRKEKQESIFLNKGTYIILGVSVSIDALVVGFTTLSNINSLFILFYNTIFIGLITAIMCGLAIVLSKYIKKIFIISSYADYIGGIILILFGIKMIFF